MRVGQNDVEARLRGRVQLNRPGGARGGDFLFVFGVTFVSVRFGRGRFVFLRRFVFRC